MGRVRPVGNPRIAEVWKWAVSNFGKFLIFYQINGDGIDTVRVLHGARDIDRILDEETVLQKDTGYRPRRIPEFLRQIRSGNPIWRRAAL